MDDADEEYEVDFLRKGDEGERPSARAGGADPLDTMLQAVSGTGERA